MTSPAFRNVRRAVYALKRAYGQPAYVCRTLNASASMTTGLKTDDVQKIYVARIVVLPSHGIRDFAYDLSFIKANPSFTYGGTFDHRTRKVLVDQRDLPSDFVIDQTVYVLLNGQRYEIKEYNEYEHGECVLLVIDGLDGALPLDAHDESASDDAGLTSQVDDS